MSTKRVLIAGGDSYTVRNQHIETPNSWAHYLAETNGWKEYNVARGGASCSYIFNTTIDAIEKYKNDNPVVVVMWSEPMRVNYLDITDIILECEDNLIKQSTQAIGSKNKFTESYIEYISQLTSIVCETFRKSAESNDLVDAYESAVNSGLRYMYLLEEYCKFNNIEYYHGASISPFGSYNVAKTLSYAFNPEESTKLKENNAPLNISQATALAMHNVKKTNYYQYLNESKSYMGFEYDSWSIIENVNLRISEFDHHPNDDGHRLLAKIIGKFIENGERMNANNNVYKRPVYIYD